VQLDYRLPSTVYRRSAVAVVLLFAVPVDRLGGMGSAAATVAPAAAVVAAVATSRRFDSVNLQSNRKEKK
jgi:hypothetical protein